MKYIILTTSLIFSTTLFSQKNNCISFKVGEIAFTDWVNRYGLQPSIVYTYTFLNQIEISNVASFYYYDKLGHNDIPSPGYVSTKLFIENSTRVGIKFNSENDLKISSGIGLSIRHRKDDIIASSSDGEIIGPSFGGIEIGGAIYIEINYFLSEKYSMGIYSQTNLYIPYKDITLAGVTHTSPSAFGYGLSIGRHF